MAITRIQNNQITDATIVAYAKLAAGSLTGNLFAPTVTLNSNVTINGNLFLSNTGNVTTINATNTYINDPLVVFNNGYSGSLNGYDIGFLVNRNLATLNNYGGVNTFLGWVEADGAFETLATSDTGTGTTSINSAGFTNFKTGNLTTTGAASIGGNLSVTNAATIGASLQVPAIGNATPGTAAFTNLTASGPVTFTNSTASTNTGTGALIVTGGVGIGGNLNVFGNITTATGNIITTSTGIFYGAAGTGMNAIYAGLSSGYSILPNVVLQLSTSINNYSQVNQQNVNNGALASTDYVATAGNGNDSAYFVDMGIASNTYSYPGYGAIRPNDSYLLANGGNLLLTTGNVGKAIVVASGGSNLTDIVATFNAPGTAASSGTSGALVITGGIAANGAVYTGGIGTHGGGLQATPIGNATPSTAAFTTATAGGLQATAIGNVTPGTATFTTATINSTTNATSITTGALTVAGGASIQQDLWIGGNIYANALNTVTTVQLQVNQPLLYLASNASPYTFDIGFYGHYVGGGPTPHYQHTGLVRDYNNNYWTFFSNVGEPSANVVNLSDPNLLFDTIKSGGLILANATAASSTSTGALVVTGGAGIGGAVYAGSIQNTPIGSTIASTAAFTTVTAGGLQAVQIGNVTPGAATFTTVQTNSTFTACGTVSASSGASTTNNSTGALQVTGGTAITGNINVGGQMFIGASAQATALTSALAVKRGTSTSGAGVQFTQDALINASNNGSSDFIA